MGGVACNLQDSKLHKNPGLVKEIPTFFFSLNAVLMTRSLEETIFITTAIKTDETNLICVTTRRRRTILNAAKARSRTTILTTFTLKHMIAISTRTTTKMLKVCKLVTMGTVTIWNVRATHIHLESLPSLALGIQGLVLKQNRMSVVEKAAI